jgi:hypothetical protein
MNDPESLLWLFFTQHYDDWVLHPSTDEARIFITARTNRVLEAVFGSERVEKSISQWATDGSIKVLGSHETLGADEPCIQILDYVKRFHS